MSTTSDMQDANLQKALITYEKLQDIEDDFEEVELEILRQQDKLSRNIYAKREKVVAEIPEFWPLVIEQAPPEIDEYIQPTDSEVLLNSLKSLSVERFELPEGDPRSIAIKLEFKENEYFENTVLEKKFWWRFAKDGWAGLVSEPVDIKWKAGKDLTGGMLAKVIKVWEEEKAAGGQPDAESETAKALKEQMENTGIGGLSFFSWFGFRGRKVTDEEHQEAYKKYEEKRKARKAGNFSDHEPLEDDNDDDDDDEDEYEMEIFPTGDDLAVCIAEDLWPGAIKYFTNAQEDDNMSDIDFESDDEMGDDDDAENDSQPSKKRKA